MKTHFVMTTVPVTVIGGMILFLGCGAEPQKTGRGENGTAVSTATVAGAPAATNPAATPLQPVPGIVPAPPRLSPGVDEIVQLAQAGVGEEVLQAYIENSSVAYKLGVDEILYLHDLGLSPETIGAIVRHGQSMQDQSAAQSSGNVPSSTNAVAPPVGPSEAQPAVAASGPNADTSPVPPAVNDQAPANAYAITPPQQVNYFYQNLAPYGTWMEIPDYGWCWQPTVAVVDVGWRPYSNRGRWLWTDCGWYWQSDYSWGWAPFHYGRWYRSPACGWVWLPDTTWGPAWVTWRYSDAYCGWAPLPPGAYFDVGVGFRYHSGGVSFGFDFGLVPDCYTFIPTAYFCDRTPWYHCLSSIQVVNIFRRTTIINNYITAANRRTIVHVGPGTDAIARVTRNEIRKVTLRDTGAVGGTLIKADRLERDGKTLAVFRPTLPRQAAAPPPEITRRQESRKQSEFLAKSGALKVAVASNEKRTLVGAPTRASGEAIAPSRGTPLAAPRPTGLAPESRGSSVEDSRKVATGRPRQTAETSTGMPVISQNPRSERRSSDTSRSSSLIVKPSQTRPAPQPSAGVSPKTFESRVPEREERSRAYQPPQNPQPEFRSQSASRQPTFRADPPQYGGRPLSNPQVITPFAPPAYRQEGRQFESSPAHAPPPPTLAAPRAAEPRSSAPSYQPPHNFSPPPAAVPRAVEAPVARPSSPPPSYSPPPAASRPQPAPSSSPSQSRNDGGRKR